MELNNRKKYLIRKFYDDYLDLNKSMEDDNSQLKASAMEWNSVEQTCGSLCLPLLLPLSD